MAKRMNRNIDIKSRRVQQSVSKLDGFLRAEYNSEKNYLEYYAGLETLDKVISIKDQIIYGRRGTGKTHLLKALQEKLLADDQKYLPVYIDLRTFKPTLESDNDLYYALIIFQEIVVEVLKCVYVNLDYLSLRRLNDLFKKQYHLSPTDLRKNIAKGKRQTSEITVSLGYHLPYRWEEILEFLSQCAIPGVELVKDGAYMRTVRIKGGEEKTFCGFISVKNHPKKNVLVVSLSDTLLPVLPQVLARVKRLFDLYCEPNVVYEALQTMNEIRPGSCIPGIRVPGCFESFEMAVRVVLGQQITVKAAGALAKRLARERGLERTSAQAVGGAVGHNEISIIVPCHRVVGSDGSLTGYAVYNVLRFSNRQAFACGEGGSACRCLDGRPEIFSWFL